MLHSQIIQIINFFINFLCHSSCLQSWLEQDTSCPTCRLGLSVQSAAHIHHPDIERIIDEQENATRANNHFFHFNGKLNPIDFIILELELISI